MSRKNALLTHLAAVFVFSTVLPCLAADAVKPTADEMAQAQRFVAAKFLAPQAAAQKPGLIVAVNNRAVELNGRYKKPLQIVDKQFTRGIAAHAPSKIVVRLPSPGKSFSCEIGLDNNPQTASNGGSVVFSASVAGRNVFRSDVVRLASPAKPVEFDLKDATEFTLEVGDAGLTHLKGLKSLKSLLLAQTKVTKEGARQLQQALPHCKVKRE